MFHRDAVHAKAVKSGSEPLFASYKKLRNEIHSDIKRAKCDYYDNVVTENKSDPRKMWKKINELIREKKSAPSSSKKLSPDQFNSFFSSIGTRTAAKITDAPELKWNNPECLYTFEFSDIQESDVKKDLENLDGNSLCDVLSFDTKLLKLCASVLAPILTQIFNMSLVTRIIPTDWKLARITPIYKGKGDPDTESSYRPISVICHIAKIFEHEVHKQLLSYMELHSFITPYQSAYLKKHSTVTCLHRVVDELFEHLDDGMLAAVCFLDIEKCFDTIDHEILLFKLEKYGVKDGALEWFKII